jgi:hypothetical protein
MRRNGWHIQRDGAVLTHARHLPARFDLSAVAWFPQLRRGRLAQQIRQDMWRRFQDLRGFSPAVEVTRDVEGLIVRAGGRISGRANTQHLCAELEAMLHQPDLRARWMRSARIDEVAK